MARPSDPEARSRLLVSAREEFVEKGLDGARVETIARRAGLSKGAFYLHFPSKTDAFNELVGAVMAQLHGLIACNERFTRPRGLEDAEIFLQEWRDSDLQLFQFLVDNRDVVGLILEGGGSGSTQHLIEEFALQTERQAAAYLQLGVESGLYRRDLNVETTAAFIAGGYDRVARRVLCAREPQDLTELILVWQQQVVMGIGTPALAAAVQHSKAKAKSLKRGESEVDHD